MTGEGGGCQRKWDDACVPVLFLLHQRLSPSLLGGRPPPPATHICRAWQHWVVLPGDLWRMTRSTELFHQQLLKNEESILSDSAQPPPPPPHGTYRAPDLDFSLTPPLLQRAVWWSWTVGPCVRPTEWHSTQYYPQGKTKVTIIRPCSLWHCLLVHHVLFYRSSYWMASSSIH